MKFEITNQMYFYESMLAIITIGFLSFLAVFIGKEWYKSLLKIIKDYFKKK